MVITMIYFLWYQYLPSSDVHINKNAKFDPSSKIFEVRNSTYILFSLLHYMIESSPLHYLSFTDK